LDNRALLPDLKNYRRNFIAKGVSWPLTALPFSQDGLLKDLPSTTKKGWPWDIQAKPNSYNKKIKWPKITIVTPSFNQGLYLEKTIRSILLQNYPNLEYIIMDGNSKDQSPDIIKKYSKWISFYEIKQDNGQSHAINKGFSLASGDIYCWINSDDFFTPNALYNVVNSILEYPEKSFFYGWGYTSELVDGKEIICEFKPRKQYKRHIRIPSLVQPSCFWKKEIHEPIWEELICSMDYELWVRLIPKASLYYIKKFLSVATVHSAAKTQNEIFKKHWQADHEKIIKRHGAFTYFSWRWIHFELRLLKLLEKLLNRK